MSVQIRMTVLLESLGGKRGLTPIHIAVRDPGLADMINQLAGGLPSAAREKELRARQREMKSFQRSRHFVGRLLNTKI